MFLIVLSLPLILARMHSWWEIAVVVGLLALWLLFQTGRDKLRKYRARGWPTKPGAVANLRVCKVDGGLNGVDYWKLTFDYTYQVAQEHSGTYSFNCTSEKMADGAVAGLEDKSVCVHYKPTDESKGILWEDEVWDIWWETYWRMNREAAKPKDA